MLVGQKEGQWGGANAGRDAGDQVGEERQGLNHRGLGKPR